MMPHQIIWNNNNNNNQYIYKQRQSHAMSQRRWLATAVIFRPSDVSLGFAKKRTPATRHTAQKYQSTELVHWPLIGGYSEEGTGTRIRPRPSSLYQM